ncbi:MAG TPA: 16S rRNA (cytosine(1402)-N(4))-methyltransferase RsmH, partial [Thiotrichaceae bacterium]|nr:16S rRNA (cytosine(1402)-N(4))-methyltransferase RsmH [Thiotrichaceae bacterium]
MHYSVLLRESVEALNIKADGIYIDCTFGRGGHSRKILDKLTKGCLLAIDQDPQAIEYASVHFTERNFSIEHGSFEQLVAFCEKRNWLGKVDGILIDLGVSSPQLDDAERGFSFMRAGPLDMRMNSSEG